MKRSILFIDESGKASLIEKENEPFILTGVILQEEDLKTIEGFFTYIKRRYKINSDSPFHSYDIFENPETKISDSKARDLLKSMSDFIAIIPIKICIISTDKAGFKAALGVKSNEDFKRSAERKELKESPYQIMSSELFEWFAKSLKGKNTVGEIIVDARRGGDYQLVKTLYQCKDPSGPFDLPTRKSIKDKCVAICFAEKGYLSGGLEITDLISFTAFQHVRRAITNFEHIKLSTFWTTIRKSLGQKASHKLTEKEIRDFFRIGHDGVHKALKDYRD